MADRETCLDCIEVRAEHVEDEAADKVDLYVDVEGSSLFTGRAALSEAHEVRALVESLGQAGVGEDLIFIKQITASTHSGIFQELVGALQPARALHARSWERGRLARLTSPGKLVRSGPETRVPRSAISKFTHCAQLRCFRSGH